MEHIMQQGEQQLKQALLLALEAKTEDHAREIFGKVTYDPSELVKRAVVKAMMDG
jgi:hypothetical protein